MADPRLKTLKIKTGVLKRIVKEKSTYIKEVGIEEARYEKFKNEGFNFSFLKIHKLYVTTPTITLFKKLYYLGFEYIVFMTSPHAIIIHINMKSSIM